MILSSAGLRPLLNWPNTLVSDAAFREEQARLAGVWTFLGHAEDVAKDGDWFRTNLATRSVFVQRFGDKLGGFENRCAHRSYPLRSADKGNGPIICDFHHWQYDDEGRGVGIPQSSRFGEALNGMAVALVPVEISTCGSLIFGRFRRPGDDESLQDFLGESFPIIEALWKKPTSSHSYARIVKANWRLCVHITVEEYHVPAVHLPYWGKAGYLKREAIGYFRFGHHSAYFTNPDPNAFANMATECRGGTWRSENYRVFHIFPGFAVSHARADREHWYVSAMQFLPLAADRTLVRYWACPSPFPSAVKGPWYDQVLDRFKFNQYLRDRIVRYYSEKIQAQDTTVCEMLQTVVRQSVQTPILGTLEERIAWFEDAYEHAMTRPPLPMSL